ncbi:hypothetical protein GCM10023115_56960 [Pontixanthobacter gangjinensis]
MYRSVNKLIMVGGWATVQNYALNNPVIIIVSDKINLFLSFYKEGLWLITLE